MLSYLFVFKVYLDTDHFPISIATMLVSKEWTISVLDGSGLFTRCCRRRCHALPSFDLVWTQKQESAGSCHSASFLWGDFWVTGIPLVPLTLICGKDGAVGRGSPSSQCSAFPDLKGGCSTLAALSQKRWLSLWTTPPLPQPPCLLCPLPFSLTSVVFQPKHQRSRLLFLSFGKT